MRRSPRIDGRRRTPYCPTCWRLDRGADASRLDGSGAASSCDSGCKTRSGDRSRRSWDRMRRRSHASSLARVKYGCGAYGSCGNGCRLALDGRANKSGGPRHDPLRSRKHLRACGSTRPCGPSALACLAREPMPRSDRTAMVYGTDRKHSRPLPDADRRGSRRNGSP
jgi:hypothetical protein